MKLFRYILSALAGVSLFASCIEEEPVASYNLAIDLDKSIVAVGSKGGSATVEVNSGDITWKATSSADWIAFTPATGSGTTKVTITVGESDEDRTGEVSLRAGNLEKLITIVQTGDPHGLTEDDPLTCAEAVVLCGKLADKATTPKKYYVKGIITAIVEEFGTQYGNATFWMGDAEGEKTFEAYRIYYFDNVKYDDPTKQNISEGDNVVIYGVLMNYGGQAETSQNAAYLVKLDANTAPTISCKEPEKVVAASETEATFTIAPKNLTEGWTVSTDASWIKDYTKSGAKDATEIKVSFDANTVAEPREATFTVKSAGAKDLVLTLKQLEYQENGTADKPYTVAEALEVINALADGATTEAEVYVSGVINEVQSVDTGSYGNASYLISDTGSSEQVITVFRGYYLENAKFTAEDQIAKGDVVVVKGKLQKYVKDAVTTPEIAAKNYLHSLARPMTVAAALAEIANMTDGATAENEVYIKGIVTGTPNVDTGSYGNATFDIVDASGSADVLTVFRAYSFGNVKFTSADVFKVGDEVIVIGKLQRYVKDAVMTPEVSKGHLVAVFAGNGVQPEKVPELYLNEFDCQNKQIEIYNATDAEVDMTGWIILKNDGEEGEKDTFSIPAALAKVPAKGYAVFTCKQTDAANGPLFGLSGTKGFKIALKKGDAVVDEVDNLTNIVTIEDGKSWGRETDGADKFVIFDTPTIGAANGAGTPPPAAPKTIAELIAAIPASATGSSTAVEVDVDFTEPVTVSYVNGKNAYLEDATAGILLYLENHGLQAGVTLKGQLKVTGYWYNGIPELTAYSGTPTVGQGTIPETPLTIAELLANYDKYLLRRIKLSGVTVTDAIADGDRNGKISQGTDEIAVYAQINNGGLVLTEGAVGDLITIPGYYKTTKQVYFWQNDWFTKTSADPTITVSDITNVPAAGVTGATTTVTFTDADGWAASVTPDGTVVTAASIDGTTITYTVAENTATEAREGKITVALKKDGQADITKDIKVSQKAAEAALDPNKTYYKKVTAAPDDWSGKYLLVVDKNDINKAFKGFSSTSTVYGEGADVAINASAIESDETTDAYQIVIAKATVTDGAYTIKFGDNFFVWTSGNSLNKADSESANSNWNITYETDHAVIRNAADAARNLQWNASSPRFACYGNDNQTVIQLYRLDAAETGNSGSDIPDYDPITGFTW